MDVMGGKGNDLLLEIKGLKTHFSTEDGIVRAVDDISLAIRKGTTRHIVVRGPRLRPRGAGPTGRRLKAIFQKNSTRHGIEKTRIAS